MSKIRVQFVGDGPSGFAEDRVINTFHFTGPNDYETDSPYAIEGVRRFYTQVIGSVYSVGSLLSPWVQREASVRAYDLELLPGARVPAIVPLTLAATAAPGMPEEVAVCLSLTGAPPVNARRRGRLYIGPLGDNGSVVVPGSAIAPSRPKISGSDSLGIVITGAATNMATYVHTGGLQWCIRSTVPVENFVEVYAGFIDNAWDTQRRRGPDPTDRILIGGVPPVGT